MDVNISAFKNIYRTCTAFAIWK